MADTTGLTLVCQGVGGKGPEKFGEVGQRVVRAGSGLRVVLHREERQLAMANPLDGPIVEIEVGDFERRRPGNPGSISNYRETMVLSGDEDLIGTNIPHRVVSASMAVGQLG